MVRVLGFFAKLNVLPKTSSLSSYSYRVLRKSNRKFLISMSNIFKSELEEGEFNLDFKAIPHWGDASILDKNWSGSRNKAIKSILALIVQDPSTGFLSYTDGTVKKQYQKDAVLDFVDFWKEGRAVSPKILIFDSKFTTYENLNRLNKSKEKIHRSGNENIQHNSLDIVSRRLEDIRCIVENNINAAPLLVNRKNYANKNYLNQLRLEKVLKINTSNLFAADCLLYVGNFRFCIFTASNFCEDFFRNQVI